MLKTNIFCTALCRRGWLVGCEISIGCDELITEAMSSTSFKWNWYSVDQWPRTVCIKTMSQHVMKSGNCCGPSFYCQLEPEPMLFNLHIKVRYRESLCSGKPFCKPTCLTTSSRFRKTAQYNSYSWMSSSIFQRVTQLIVMLEEPCPNGMQNATRMKRSAGSGLSWTQFICFIWSVPGA